MSDFYEKAKIRSACCIILLLGLLAVYLGVCKGEEKKEFRIINETESGFLCTYQGFEHECIAKLPENVEQMPLVVMLPGYGETAKVMQSKTEFDLDARKKGVAVLYVSGARDPLQKASAISWNSMTSEKEKDDVGFLQALVQYMVERYDIDRNAVFVAGFSNGAFMTHRLAIEAGDTFAGIISVAGMMPASVWDNRPQRLHVSVLQISGTKDDVVPRRANGNETKNPAPAIEDVCTYYALANDLHTYTSSSLSDKSVLEKYCEEGKKEQVWSVTVSDGRHSWPEENFSGFCTNELILNFIKIVQNG